MVEGVSVPSLICMVIGRALAVLGRFLKIAVAVCCADVVSKKNKKKEEKTIELSVRYYMFSGSLFASVLHICFQHASFFELWTTQRL